MTVTAVQQFYRELKEVPAGHVFVFPTTLSGGGNGISIARTNYGRPAGTSPVGLSVTGRGASYGIAIREANMVKTRPIADIVADLERLHLGALLDVGEDGAEVTWVLHDLFAGQGENYVRDLMHQVYRIFNHDHLRGKFVYPETWRNSQACKPRSAWK